MNRIPAPTPLYSWHVEHAGRMVDFSGWSLPLQYDSIMVEHLATRTAAGIFDISHMGRFYLTGPDAPHVLGSLVTRRVDNLPPGRIRYGLITNQRGGILDDVLVSHLTGSEGHPLFLLVVNAANREKIETWIRQQAPSRAAFELSDQTEATAMLAVQGPRAEQIISTAISPQLADLRYYQGVIANHFGGTCVVSRTGYTGEDGFELIVPAACALEVWQAVYCIGAPLGMKAAGLGARDTLRLEAGMPLYGHELTEEIDPFQAGLGFAVHLRDHEFPGRQALEQRQQASDTPQRAGLVLDGRRVAREGCCVFRGDACVGHVTSGTFSPTLQKSIAMAYLVPGPPGAEAELQVDIRGRRHPAHQVPLPFYHRDRRPPLHPSVSSDSQGSKS